MFKLVKSRSDTEILDLIKTSKVSKEDVFKERYGAKEDDDDIVAGLETVTLKDPYTRSKISVPVRGKACIHVQCYDAATFITMSKTAKKRECPVCFKPTCLEDLVVDGFFEDILANTPNDVESVEIGMEGKWSLRKEEVKNVVESKPKVVNEIVLLDDYSPQKPSGSGKDLLILGIKAQPEIIYLSD